MTPESRINFIKDWLIKYIKSMPKPATSLVVGVSGGIDSAVVSTICSMTGIKTLALSMPIKQIKEQDDLSKKHCKWLLTKFKNIEILNINLDEVFTNFEKALTKNNSEHAFANSRARIRMTTLYQVAGSNNGIVVGTGNKVEDFGVGFYTKYGDGGVDISPIADCTKTEVWEMGKELKIDEKIISAKPTDGLWVDGRNDENQLGMSYEELEEAMVNPNSKNYKKYQKIRETNLHKMKEIPVCKFD
ncbi:MAG: NAD(+) synthase [Candidatus Pelagibacter sp.]|nr:NAD(+) synthase [Candidatus Pelagibacter sp.]OUW11588.1 MAG: NAD(+) synthase [Candidatus Pelagibacter sp. TMED166]|tara:strand:+ start:8685 stop:9419 length:735 start_codon:yes stop_codon:yes gene_type:complete